MSFEEIRYGIQVAFSADRLCTDFSVSPSEPQLLEGKGTFSTSSRGFVLLLLASMLRSDQAVIRHIELITLVLLTW